MSSVQLGQKVKDCTSAFTSLRTLLFNCFSFIIRAFHKYRSSAKLALDELSRLTGARGCI